MLGDEEWPPPFPEEPRTLPGSNPEQKIPIIMTLLHSDSCIPTDHVREEEEDMHREVFDALNHALIGTPK